MKKLALALLVLSVSAQAWATEGSTAWWIFYGATVHCEPATQFAQQTMMPQFDTPYGYRQYERGFPHDYKGYSLMHLPEGLVVAFHIGHGRVIYAANWKACKAMAGIIASVTKRRQQSLGELK
jgi:hypothetical protein